MKLNLDIDVNADGTADIKKVERGVEDLGKTAEQTDQKTSKFGAAFSGIFAGIVAANLIGKLTSQVAQLGREAIALGDQMRNLSETTGFSVETLSSLDVKAKQAGASIEEMRVGIVTLARIQQDAMGGAQMYADMFERIGVSMDDLQRLSPEELFERVAQGLGRIESASERAAVAQRLMGEGGTKLIPVLNTIAQEGLAGITEEAARMGYLLRTDTAEALAITAANLEVVKRAATVTTGEIFRMGAVIAGSLRDTRESFDGSLSPMQKFIDKLTTMAGDVLVAMGFVEKLGAVVLSTIGGLADAIPTSLQELLQFRVGEVIDTISAEVQSRFKEIDSATNRALINLAARGRPGGGSNPTTPTLPTLPNLLEIPALKEQRDIVGEILAAQRSLAETLGQREALSREIVATGEHELELTKNRVQLSYAAEERDQVRLQYQAKRTQILEDERRALADLATKDISATALEERRLQIREETNLEIILAEREMFEQIRDIEMEHERERFLRWQREIEKSARVFGTAYQSIIQSLLAGDSVGDAISHLFDSFLRGWEDTLMEMSEGWIETLASWSKGLTPESGPRAGEAPTAGQQQGAKFGLAALQGGVALAGIYDQSQGVPKGEAALSGAITGAMAGAQIYGWVGAIVGALIGGVAGYLSGGVDSKGFRVTTGPDGMLSISGFGDTKQREVEQAQRDLNETISKVRGTMFDLFTLLPTSVLEALTSITPDLDFSDGRFQREFGESKSAVDAIKDFINVTVPQMIIDEYFDGPLGQALDVLGLTGKKINELQRKMKSVDFDEAQRLLSDYLGALVGLMDSTDFQTLREKVTDVRAEMDRTVLDQITDIDSRIKILSSGFGDLPLEEQITRAKTLNDLLQERNVMEQQMIEGLLRLSDQITETIDAQIFAIEQTQRTEEEQIDALLERQRGLFAALGEAQTEEEIARIMGLIQGNASELFNMMGQTPEAAEQITAMLRDAESLAQTQINSIIEAAVEIDNLLAQVLDDILNFLRGVSDERGRTTRRPGSGEGDGGGGGGGGGGRGGGFVDDFDTAVVGATSSVVSFGEALERSVTQLPQNITVEVTVEGSAEPFLRAVDARIREVSRYEAAEVRRSIR